MLCHRKLCLIQICFFFNMSTSIFHLKWVLPFPVKIHLFKIFTWATPGSSLVNHKYYALQLFKRDHKGLFGFRTPENQPLETPQISTVYTTANMMLWRSVSKWTFGQYLPARPMQCISTNPEKWRKNNLWGIFFWKLGACTTSRRSVPLEVSVVSCSLTRLLLCMYTVRG